MLATEYNVSIGTIHNTLQKHKIPVEPTQKITSDYDNLLKQLYLTERKNTYVIAEELRVDAATIQRRLKKLGVEIRDNAECHRRFSIDQHYFDRINTPDKAYFLGLLYADGSNFPIDSKGKEWYHIILSLSGDDDVSVLTTFRRYLKTDIPIRKIIPSNPKHKPIYRLTICSKHMSQQLEKLGISKGKTYNATYPDFLNQQLHSHFIRGVFDGDGSISIQTNRPCAASFDITTASNVSKGIANIISSYDLADHMHLISDKRSPSILHIQFSRVEQILKVMDWLYKDCKDLYMNRKYIKYIDLKKRYKRCRINNT